MSGLPTHPPMSASGRSAARPRDAAPVSGYGGPPRAPWDRCEPGHEEYYLTAEQELAVVAEARWHLAGYTLVAWDSLRRGLVKLEVDPLRIAQDLGRRERCDMLGAVRGDEGYVTLWSRR